MRIRGEYDKKCEMTASNRVFAKTSSKCIDQSDASKLHRAIHERGSQLGQIQAKCWRPRF